MKSLALSWRRLSVNKLMDNFNLPFLNLSHAYVFHFLIVPS